MTIKERSVDPVPRVETVIERGDPRTAVEFLDGLPPGESIRVVDQLAAGQRADFVSLLPDDAAASLLETLPGVQAAEVIESLPVEESAAIIDRMPSDEQVDLLEEVDAEVTQAILERMEPRKAEAVRFLSHYDPDSAGGLMETEYLQYEEEETVDDVLRDLRQNANRYSSYNVQYAYIVSEGGLLSGVLRLRDLLLSHPTQPIASIMVDDPVRVIDTTSLQELNLIFDRHPLLGLPVVTADGRIVGVVRRADVEQDGEERAGRMLLKFAGILGGEELRSMRLRTRCVRRLSWLSINIVLNVVAASVIALYQDTLSAVIALAVFLPIVSDMSGCSGNQAVAVSMRELVLGIVRPGDFFRVLRKELSLGLVNGLVLGGLLGSVGFLWKGNLALGFVVGGALAANTLVAVCLGALITLGLRSFRLDPALASGPLLTTVTDMCGFFFVLSLAQIMLPYLTA